MGLLTNLAAAASSTTYRYSTTVPSSDDAMLGAMFAAIFGVFGLLFGAAFYVVNSIFMMKLFKKANVAAWKAWVPFVNTWTFLQLGGQKGAWAFGSIGAIVAFILISIFGVVGVAVASTSSSAGAGAAVAFLIASGICYVVAFAGATLTTVFSCIAAHNIGKKLSFDPAFVILYIFFSIVWLGIAGLGKAEFDDKQGKPSLAPTVN